jgi:HK97 family phage portal protein
MLNPAWVDIEMKGQFRRYSMGGLDITDDVLHIRYKSWPGNPHGIGPLEALASNLFGAAALERYQAGLATRGGIPWGVLTAPGNLSQDQAVQLRENFVQARLSARGAPAVLSGGVQLTPLYINPKDMALLELRQFDEARIATLLGVPPTLLSLPTGDTSMTYRNAESIYDFHWRASLKPKADKITEAISNWALPRGQTIELNRDAYVRPPLSERINAWNVAFNMHDPVTGKRLLELEEIRAIERFTTAQEAASAPSQSSVVPG